MFFVLFANHYTEITLRRVLKQYFDWHISNFIKGNILKYNRNPTAVALVVFRSSLNSIKSTRVACLSSTTTDLEYTYLFETRLFRGWNMYSEGFVTVTFRFEKLNSQADSDGFALIRICNIHGILT